MANGWRISKPEQLDALVSGVRQDIVDTLLTVESMTVRELARHLGMKPSALYYHLAELERVDLVDRTEREREDGRREACYSVADARLEIRYRPSDPENRRAVTRVVGSILRLAGRDFERGFDHPDVEVDGPGRNLWGARGKAWLDEEDVKRANELLRELSALFSREPAPGGTLCALSWVLTPVQDRGLPTDS